MYIDFIKNRTKRVLNIRVEQITIARQGKLGLLHKDLLQICFVWQAGPATLVR